MQENALGYVRIGIEACCFRYNSLRSIWTIVYVVYIRTEWIEGRAAEFSFKFISTEKEFTARNHAVKNREFPEMIKLIYNIIYNL